MTAPRPTLAVQQFDWHHATLILAFVFGVVIAAVPFVRIALADYQAHLSATPVLIGLLTLAGTAVGAYFKLPPGATIGQAEATGEGVGSVAPEDPPPPPPPVA